MEKEKRSTDKWVVRLTAVLQDSIEAAVPKFRIMPRSKRQWNEELKQKKDFVYSVRGEQRGLQRQKTNEHEKGSMRKR